MRRRRADVLLALALTPLAAGSARAEPSPPEIPKLEAPGPFGSKLRLEASARLRAELVDWFDTDPAGPTRDDDYGFYGNRLQLGLRATRGPLELFAQLQHSSVLDLPEHAPGPGGSYFANTPRRDQNRLFLRNGWLRWRNAFGAEGLSLQAGRQLYRDGLEAPSSDSTLLWLQRNRIAERLIGPFDYTHVGRSFDGGMLAWDSTWVNATGFWFVPTQGGFEIDANRQIDDVNVAGLSATAKRVPLLPNTTGRLFWTFYRDDRDIVFADNRALAVRQADPDGMRMHSVGGHAMHVEPIGHGRLDALVWWVGQLGDWQSLDHEAWAYAVEVGYQLPDVWGAPWLRAGIDQSSGDSNPGDRDHETFFQMLPTARMYAQFPFYNLMNDRDVFAQLVWKPHPLVTIRNDVHWLRLSESSDLLYAGGGATSDSSFGFSGTASQGSRKLATLADLSVTFQPTSQLTLYLYYGHAFGSSLIDRVFRSDGADYGYLELSLAF
jgi:hypothetical protein